MDADIQGHTAPQNSLFTNNLMIQHSNVFIFPINTQFFKAKCKCECNFQCEVVFFCEVDCKFECNIQ